GRPALRLALGAVGGPGGETTSVVLSLGLGLTVLATIGQIDANLRSALQNELPARAPAFFFVDIPRDQMTRFEELTHGSGLVDEVNAAPLLRGIITRINDRPAREVAGNHWVLRGDRGITYSAAPPSGTTLTEGTWWPEDYSGPPQMSFSAEAAEEMGLKLGDMVTLNILGRSMTAEITSFREVDFSTMGINFLIVMNPAALSGAPHTFIATAYAPPEAEAGILRSVAGAMPNVTAISVREGIARAAENLGNIAAAIRGAAAITLLTGFVVLIGAAAAGERRRAFEAAILKTLGAVRRSILASFALRSAMLGAAAGVVALAGGAIASWAVMTFVMQARFVFDPVSAVAIVAGGATASLVAGLLFAWRPLAVRPARVLRARE
ncbi:MAG: drug:proton antiporter, partial [Rhodobacteraceae bacterium]|nr:drug:proton antiporter [Paracoccaceae bacterium]